MSIITSNIFQLIVIIEFVNLNTFHILNSYILVLININYLSHLKDYYYIDLDTNNHIIWD